MSVASLSSGGKRLQRNCVRQFIDLLTAGTFGEADEEGLYPTLAN